MANVNGSFQFLKIIDSELQHRGPENEIITNYQPVVLKWSKSLLI